MSSLRTKRGERLDPRLYLEDRDGRKSTRTREFYVEALREYYDRYGELTAACFAPASARRNGRPDLVERYYAPRANGTAWPSLNAIKKTFEGSFDAARAALGLPPNSTGPASGRRPSGSAEPILTVRERRVVIDGGATVALRRQLEKAQRRAARAEERLEEAKARVVEVPTPVVDEKLVGALRERLADEQARRRDIQKTLNNAERRETRARARADAAKSIARAGSPVALREVERLTDRLADAQVRIRELENAVRTGSRQVELPKTKTVTKTVKVKDAAMLRQIERAEARIVELRAELAKSESLRADATERLAEIKVEAVAEAVATSRVRSAIRRAEIAEKKAAEAAELLVGQRRSLTRAEVKDLRRDGPAGEMVVTAALRRLRRARVEGGKIDQALALRELAAAALTWSDKL